MLQIIENPFPCQMQKKKKKALPLSGTLQACGC